VRRAAIAGALAAGVLGCGGRREEPPPPPPPAAPPPCPVAAGKPVAGRATSYDADGTGSCSFDAQGSQGGRGSHDRIDASPDRAVAAMNAADWAKAAWCGACVEVTGPHGRTTVRIVDRCPACKHGELDLSREAFAAIAKPEAGRVLISWRPVPCEVAGPIAYRFKDGSNASWAAIQIRNHRYAIASLEARDRSGRWKALPRADYNYFVAAGELGSGPAALRVTDVRGQTVEDTAITLGDAVTRAGAAQFPRCPGD
jgi:expansin (peptidoglycan-binding protein)